MNERLVLILILILINTQVDMISVKLATELYSFNTIKTKSSRIESLWRK
jgi:hypothetical protein